MPTSGIFRFFVHVAGRPIWAPLLMSAAVATAHLPSAEAAPRERPRAQGAEKADAVTLPEGPLAIVISIRDQKLAVYAGTEQIAQSKVSSGTRGHETPTGIFSVIQKERMHYSNLYNSAPMPFMQRITWSGVALHAGYLPGYAASHGCVRLPPEFARKLYEMTKLGARVIVTGGAVSPNAITHPQLTALTSLVVADAAAAMAPPPMHLGGLQPDGGPREGAQNAEAKGPGSPVSLLKKAQLLLADSMTTLTSAKAAKVAAAQQLEDAVAILQQARDAQAVGRAELAKARAKVQRAEGEVRSAEAKAGRMRDTGEDKPANGAAQPVDAAVLTARAELEAIRKDFEDKDETLREISDEFDAADRGRASASVANEDAALRVKLAEDAVKEARRDLQKRQQPISIFVSRKTGKLYVRQGFDPLLEVPLQLDRPELPVGTHVFTALGAGAAGEPGRWSVMSVPGYAPPEKADTRRGASARDRSEREATAPAQGPLTGDAALQRLQIPAEVVAQIGELVKPGSSLIISDQGLSPETGKYTDMIVQTR